MQQEQTGYPTFRKMLGKGRSKGCKQKRETCKETEGRAEKVPPNFYAPTSLRSQLASVLWYNVLMLTREDIAFMYLEQLPFEPYPFQEEAILGWFSSEQGVLVCAPTGMGKTLIAEAGIYEVMKTGKKAYYTTPLIALTEQKYREIQAALERWGYSKHYVGLVTGNRKENPDAPILVVVAEILFNRLLTDAGKAGNATTWSDRFV